MDWEHKAQGQAIKDIKQMPAFLLVACLPIDGESVEKLVELLRKRIKEESRLTSKQLHLKSLRDRRPALISSEGTYGRRCSGRITISGHRSNSPVAGHTAR